MSFTDTKGFTSEENQGDIVIYQTEDGETKIDVRFVDETVWLSLDQLSVLFERNKSTISRHLKNIFEEGELERDSVVAKIATTAADGKTYRVDYYNRCDYFSRLPCTIPYRHPIPPLGNRAAKGIYDQGFHHGRRTPEKSGRRQLLERAA